MFTFNFNLDRLDCFKKRRRRQKKKQDTPNDSININIDEIRILLESMESIPDLSKLQIILFKLMTEKYNIGMIMKLTINDNGIPTATTLCSMGLHMDKIVKYSLINYPIIRKGTIIGSLSIGTVGDYIVNNDKYKDVLNLIGDSLRKL